MTEASSPLGRLLHRLSLEPLAEHRFAGGSGRGGVTENNRLFGGLVLGQATMAASRTVEVEQFALHALQAQFLRPTAPDQPVIYEVQRTKDGRRFANRLILARQNDRIMLTAQASFSTFVESPLAHQRPAPECPDPESLPNRDAARGRAQWREAPIDIRLIDPLPEADQRYAPATRFWIRPGAAIPANQPRLHEALLVYATDRTLLGTAFLPYGPDHARGVSLDHSLHLYQPLDFNQWLLYDMASPVAGYQRGYVQGFLYQRDGKLVAAVTQEGTLTAAGR